MSMTNVNMNAVATESVTVLKVHILIDEKEILWQALQNEKVVKGVLMGFRCMQNLRVYKLSMRPHS